MSVISINNLTRDYGNNKGIFNITLNVEKGEVFGFLGPNGAGKTTTIRHLMGFIKPKMGSCLINDLDCFSKASEIQKTLGYIPGEISFFDDMSGLDFLNFLEKFRGVSNSRKDELIEYFDLNPKGKIKKMSKGMKQKIGIVAAFMHDPDILILDEPTSGLDPLMQKKFIDLLESEKKRGKTILISSHIFEEVEKTCDRVGIIKEGKIVAVDSIEALRKRHVRSYSVTLANEELASSFAKDFDGECQGNRVIVSAKASLEDIFLNYYEGEK